MEVQQKKKSWYKKWWIWLIIVLVIGAIGSMNQEEDQANVQSETSKPEVKQTTSKSTNEGNQKEENKEVVEDVISVSSVDLWNAYDENEVSADQKYKDKKIEITGTVNDIGKDILDSIYITLKTDDLLGSVQVYFSDKDADSIANLSKGQKVIIEGKVSGKSLTNVIIKKAQVK